MLHQNNRDSQRAVTMGQHGRQPQYDMEDCLRRDPGLCE